MRQLILFIFISISTLANSQSKNEQVFLGSVVSDSLFERRNLSDEFKIENIFKSKNTIEIRLYSHLSESKTECAILWYSDSFKSWKLTKYIYEKINSKLLMELIEQKNSVLDASFNQLVSSNIFSLTNQNKINNTKYYINLDTKEISLLDVNLSDGVCYYVEFKILNDYRQYNYCNPNIFLNTMPNTSEYSDFVRILKTFSALTKK